MTQLFEMPQLLTLGGDPFNSEFGWGDPGSCGNGCNGGCHSGCIQGGGGNTGDGGGDFPPDIKG